VRTVPGQPLEVLFGGTVAPVLRNVTVTNNDANAIPVRLHANDLATIPITPYMAQAITNAAPIAVTAVAAALVAANAARRGFRVKNIGANPVAIGGAGLTFANAVLVIQPGETWNEDEAAGAAWVCICDATLTSTINLQTIA